MQVVHSPPTPTILPPNQIPIENPTPPPNSAYTMDKYVLDELFGVSDVTLVCVVDKKEHKPEKIG